MKEAVPFVTDKRNVFVLRDRVRVKLADTCCDWDLVSLSVIVMDSVFVSVTVVDSVKVASCVSVLSVCEMFDVNVLSVSVNVPVRVAWKVLLLRVGESMSVCVNVVVSLCVPVYVGTPVTVAVLVLRDMDRVSVSGSVFVSRDAVALTEIEMVPVTVSLNVGLLDLLKMDSVNVNVLDSNRVLCVLDEDLVLDISNVLVMENVGLSWKGVTVRRSVSVVELDGVGRSWLFVALRAVCVTVRSVDPVSVAVSVSADFVTEGGSTVSVSVSDNRIVSDTTAENVGVSESVSERLCV